MRGSYPEFTFLQVLIAPVMHNVGKAVEDYRSPGRYREFIAAKKEREASWTAAALRRFQFVRPTFSSSFFLASAF
ncbi:MAG: hypothetical protein M3Y82_08780 [Verrucomicrobiota bacterium]|nr:hypothetical protein [Verrucomicrobiota bacterium]